MLKIRTDVISEMIPNRFASYLWATQSVHEAFSQQGRAKHEMRARVWRACV